MITKLTLNNFRKFKERKFEFDKNITILYGKNAQGKSSVLEALYLVSSGKSPWTTADEYINTEQKNTNTHKNKYREWMVNHSYILKMNQKGHLKIDGKNVKPKNFSYQFVCYYIQPEKIELLMIIPQHKEKLLRRDNHEI
jgi:DNA replication and repair protein RecF